ncbi:hypothetical protein LZ31DRAFT_547731, partial [Colletotrichum somersetense]
MYHVPRNISPNISSLRTSTHSTDSPNTKGKKDGVQHRIRRRRSAAAPLGRHLRGVRRDGGTYGPLPPVLIPEERGAGTFTRNLGAVEAFAIVISIVIGSDVTGQAGAASHKVLFILVLVVMNGVNGISTKANTRLNNL